MERMKKCVYYSEYGAVGDGITDDHAAILRAHTDANENGYTVKADEGKTYYIPPHDTTIPILTSVDWTGAKFIIDDRDINFNGHFAQHTNLFTVMPSLERFNMELGAIKIGDTNIGAAPGVNALIHIECNEIKHYIRYGGNANNGSAQTEILKVDKDGNIDERTPVIWDYPKITKCFAIPIDEEPITIEGGEFLTLANEINCDRYLSTDRNIFINRSNTIVKNVKHSIEQVKPYRSAYGGFFNTSYCNNVLIKDCVIQCHKGMYFDKPRADGSIMKILIGSYELLADHCNDIIYDGLYQTNLFDENGKLISQGLMGTNYCRNMVMQNCTVARFDAHCQVHNLLIKNCVMERINTIGFGKVIVEDTEIWDHFIFNLRSDYGSTFCGDYYLKNIKMMNTDKERLSLFLGAWVNHDFGYTVYYPQNVVIENMSAPEGAVIGAYTANFDEYEDVTKEILENGEENKNRVVVTKSLKVVSNPAGTKFLDYEGKIPFPKFTYTE